MVLDNINKDSNTHIFSQKYIHSILKYALFEDKRIKNTCKNNNINLTTLNLNGILESINFEENDIDMQFLDKVMDRIYQIDIESEEIFFVTNIQYNTHFKDLNLIGKIFHVELNSLNTFINKPELTQPIVASKHDNWNNLTVKFNKNDSLYKDLDIYAIGNGILGLLRLLSDGKIISEYSEYEVNHEEMITVIQGTPYYEETIDQILFDEKIRITNNSLNDKNIFKNQEKIDNINKEFIPILVDFLSLYNKSLNNKDINYYFFDLWRLFERIIKYYEKDDEFDTEILKKIIINILKKENYYNNVLPCFVDILTDCRHKLTHENEEDIIQESNIIMKFLVDTLLLNFIDNSNELMNDYNKYINKIIKNKI